MELIKEMYLENDVNCTNYKIRKAAELLQFSYYYKSKVIGQLVETAYTEEEKNNGFILEWKTLDEAIALLESDKPIDYEGQFIVKRDLEFLQYFMKLENN